MRFLVQYGNEQTYLDQQNSSVALYLALPCLLGPKQEIIHEDESLDIVRTNNFIILKNGQSIAGVTTQEIKTDAIGYIAEEIYLELFEATRDYNLVRLWNYLPDINGQVNQVENYHSFCKGRALAFSHQGKAGIFRYPAASAVGTSDNNFSVYFVGFKESPEFYENPQQQPAYTYPKEYGTYSPSFSRAGSIQTTYRQIYVSGTASILGCETINPYDMENQLKLTIKNLKIILDKIQKEQNCKINNDAIYMKVYLRNTKFTEKICNALRFSFQLADTQLTLLKSNICRADLETEIEISIRKY